MREEKEKKLTVMGRRKETKEGRQNPMSSVPGERCWRLVGTDRCLADAADIRVSAKPGWAPEFHMEWASVNPAAGAGQRERLPHPSWKNCPRRPHTCRDRGLKTGGSLSFTQASGDPAEAEQTACYLLSPRPPDRGGFVCAFR